MSGPPPGVNISGGKGGPPPGVMPGDNPFSAQIKKMAEFADQKDGPTPAKLAPGNKPEKPILGYWQLRALANSIKYLLEYVGEDYEEDQYTSSDMGRRWFTNKFQLGMTFPNLPFYFDTDGKRIAQSNAILRHLARKYPQIDAKNDDERVQLDVLENCLKEYRDMHIHMVYRTMELYDRAKAMFFDQFLPIWMRELSTQLGSNPWLIGDRITYVDFVAYELLVVLSWHIVGCLDMYENLQQYLTRFEALPAINKYMQSERFIATPVYAPFAKWNAPTDQQLQEYKERIKKAGSGSQSK